MNRIHRMAHRMSHCLTQCLALFCLLQTLVYGASPTISETWLIHDAPTIEQIQNWNRLPSTPTYRVHLKDPLANEISILSELKTQNPMELIVERYPDSSQLSAIQNLVQKGIKLRLILMPTGYLAAWPTEGELAGLATLKLLELRFVLPTFPAPEDGPLFNALSQNTHTTILFATVAYPKFMDREGLRSLPSNIELTFAANYWPAYAHMDVINMIPHRIRLRVQDLFPMEEDLPYTQALVRLDGITIQSTYDPTDVTFWKTITPRPITWISVGRVPSEHALQNFASSQIESERNLVIDQDFPLTNAELSRLQKWASQNRSVYWTHLAPSGD